MKRFFNVIFKPFIFIYGLLMKLKKFISSDPFLENIFFSTINVLGNLLPMLIGLLFYALKPNLWKDFSIFYSEGQFYLYSTSLLTSVWYILYTHKKKNFDSYSFFLLFTSLLILGASVSYSILLTNDDNTSQDVLKYSSIGVFIITLVLFYISNFINIKKINAHDIRVDDIKELMKEVSESKSKN